jgi:hypothetical protein
MEASRKLGCCTSQQDKRDAASDCLANPELHRLQLCAKLLKI